MMMIQQSGSWDFMRNKQLSICILGLRHKYMEYGCCIMEYSMCGETINAPRSPQSEPSQRSPGEVPIPMNNMHAVYRDVERSARSMVYNMVSSRW